ncbi:MAG TPA: hypothetical protein VLY04_04200 [Bryobacteraceae bacterium]|nr:hypothetical protein [Bryobacteraceae bacterium]
MKSPKFWPLDIDPEGEIYDNVAWDLPGYRIKRPARRKSPKRSASRNNLR